MMPLCISNVKHVGYVISIEEALLRLHEQCFHNSPLLADVCKQHRNAIASAAQVSLLAPAHQRSFCKHLCQMKNGNDTSTADS